MLADWRDPSDYPAVEGTQLPRWHWEFLRRNGAYQSDFERYQALGRGAANRWERDQLARKYGLDGIMLDYREAHIQLFQSPRPTARVRLIQWQTAWVGEDEKGRLIEGHREDMEYLDPRIRQHECCVVLNLRQPLETQLETARERVAKLQERYAEKRGQVGCYPLYLRLIDAWDAHVDEQEMSALILPEADPRLALKKIRNDLKEARRLRDVDYRYI